MAEVTIPKEKLDYTIDLLIAMVTEEIAEETGKDRKEVLTIENLSIPLFCPCPSLLRFLLSP